MKSRYISEKEDDIFSKPRMPCFSRYWNGKRGYRDNKIGVYIVTVSAK